MLFEKRHYCVLCKKYCPAHKMSVIQGEIGVCENCRGQLNTTKEKNFDGGDGIIAVFSPYFYENSLKKAIREFKFSGQRLFGELFGEMIYEELKDISYIWEYDAVIPVPLHPTRYEERGYNQAEIIADKISKLSGVPMISDGLFRIKKTKKQSSLKGLERRENVKGAFYAYPGAVSEKRIILVDDICTMGETLRAAKDALKKGGAGDIIAITLCVTPVKEIKRLADIDTN